MTTQVDFKTQFGKMFDALYKKAEKGLKQIAQYHESHESSKKVDSRKKDIEKSAIHIVKSENISEINKTKKNKTKMNDKFQKIFKKISPKKVVADKMKEDKNNNTKWKKLLEAKVKTKLPKNSSPKQTSTSYPEEIRSPGIKLIIKNSKCKIIVTNEHAQLPDNSTDLGKGGANKKKDKTSTRKPDLVKSNERIKKRVDKVTKTERNGQFNNNYSTKINGGSECGANIIIGKLKSKHTLLTCLPTPSPTDSEKSVTKGAEAMPNINTLTISSNVPSGTRIQNISTSSNDSKGRKREPTMKPLENHDCKRKAEKASHSTKKKPRETEIKDDKTRLTKSNEDHDHTPGKFAEKKPSPDSSSSCSLTLKTMVKTNASEVKPIDLQPKVLSETIISANNRSMPSIFQNSTTSGHTDITQNTKMVHQNDGKSEQRVVTKHNLMETNSEYQTLEKNKSHSLPDRNDQRVPVGPSSADSIGSDSGHLLMLPPRRRPSMSSPKYLLVLVQHKNKTEDLFTKTGSPIHKLEFDCMNAVMKEMLAARSELMRNGISEKTNTEQILASHISYLTRKREELQKKFDSRYKEIYKGTCSALNRLFEVKSYMEVDKNSMFPIHE